MLPGAVGCTGGKYDLPPSTGGGGTAGAALSQAGLGFPQEWQPDNPKTTMATAGHQQPRNFLISGPSTFVESTHFDLTLAGKAFPRERSIRQGRFGWKVGRVYRLKGLCMQENDMNSRGKSFSR
jgi:hypothetical protein